MVRKEYLEKHPNDQTIKQLFASKSKNSKPINKSNNSKNVKMNNSNNNSSNIKKNGNNIDHKSKPKPKPVQKT